ncbi:MAG: hypothetical protein HOP02_09265 [Methylococcaceae bacterium]|nr:hypothetical protein [Methylococcaceae bacterium]
MAHNTIAKIHAPRQAGCRAVSKIRQSGEETTHTPYRHQHNQARDKIQPRGLTDTSEKFKHFRRHNRTKHAAQHTFGNAVLSRKVQV